MLSVFIGLYKIESASAESTEKTPYLVDDVLSTGGLSAYTTKDFSQLFRAQGLWWLFYINGSGFFRFNFPEIIHNSWIKQPIFRKHGFIQWR